MPELGHRAPPRDLVDGLLRGERLALTRMITHIEQGSRDARDVMRRLYPRTGRAHVIGVTGPPGSGKSTLTMRLAAEYRRREHTVGVVAVDPTSPYSGGAILGDRIRMLGLYADPGVFVRSMATRGSLGGVARTTMEVVSLLDAFGMDVVIVETVGVGQDEVEVARMADTTVVVSVPGLGDDIQAIKAGVLEIADILVVNKADLDQAKMLVRDLRIMLSLGTAPTAWTPPIVETVATEDRGIAALVDHIAEHRACVVSSGNRQQRREEHARRQVQLLIEDETRLWFERLASDQRWRARFNAVAAREEDPYSVVEDALRAAGGQYAG